MFSNIIQILTVTYNQLKCILAEQKTISKNVFCPQTFEKSTNYTVFSFFNSFQNKRVNFITVKFLNSFITDGNRQCIYTDL